MIESRRLTYKWIDRLKTAINSLYLTIRLILSVKRILLKLNISVTLVHFEKTVPVIPFFPIRLRASSPCMSGFIHVDFLVFSRLVPFGT